MPDTILILSDTHFGRPHGSAKSPDALRPLWAGASHLVFNGDLAEVHHPHHRGAAARAAVRLLELCERDGVEVTLLSGNHDPFISDHRKLELFGGLVFVTHGDVFHPAVAPWSPRAPRMRDVNRRALARLVHETGDLLEARLEAAQHASRAEWENLSEQAARSGLGEMIARPWTFAQVLWYWHRFPKVAASFLARHAPRARFLVAGHTHHAGVWEVGDRVIVNTGSYGWPGKPRAVVMEGGELRVRGIEFDAERGVYGFEAEPLARYEIPDSHEAAAAPPARKTRPESERPSARST